MIDGAFPLSCGETLAEPCTLRYDAVDLVHGGETFVAIAITIAMFGLLARGAQVGWPVWIMIGTGAVLVLWRAVASLRNPRSDARWFRPGEMGGFAWPWVGACLIIIPLVVYGLAYIPYLQLGHDWALPGGPGYGWSLDELHAQMFGYHFNLKAGHEGNARSVDQPIAALLTDLKSRGLLDSTLVIWAGEFGRTPFAQGGDGRDHNQFAFSLWLAGGGTKGGTVYGETDAFGYKVLQGKTEIHDLHATMLHCLGIEHTKSTFRFSGRDMRLTDVHGHIVKEILA